MPGQIFPNPVPGTGSGTTAFSTLTSGTNVSADMEVGSGATLHFGPGGIVDANQITDIPVISTVPTDNQALAFVAANGDYEPTNLTGNVNAQTGATYTFVPTDKGKLVTFANAGAVAVTLPQANTVGFIAPWYVFVMNIGPGTVTITPTTSTIDGVATLVLYPGQGRPIFSDSVNYETTGVTNTTKVNNTPLSSQKTTNFIDGTGVTAGDVGSGQVQFNLVGTALQRAVVSLSSSDLLNLKATPKVITSSTAGTIFIPVSAVFEYTFVTTDYTGTGSNDLAISINPTVSITDLTGSSAGLMDSTQDRVEFSAAAGPVLFDPSVVSGATMQIANISGAEFMAGDGTMVVTVFYISFVL